MKALFLALAGGLALFTAAAAADPPDLESKIEAVLSELSLEEKIGQMCLGGRGSRGSYDPLPDELLADVRAGRLGAQPVSQWATPKTTKSSRISYCIL